MNRRCDSPWVARGGRAMRVENPDSAFAVLEGTLRRSESQARSTAGIEEQTRKHVLYAAGTDDASDSSGQVRPVPTG